MPSYDIFGGRLFSELTLPGLRPASAGPAAWSLRRGEPRSHAADELLDELHVHGLTMRSYRSAGGFTLTYSDAGAFDIGHDGREIVWRGPDSVHVEIVRDCLIGRVMSTAQHAAGLLCLHGSAVSLVADRGDQAIAFLAPPFHGKSTLAMALTRAGARLLTDDTVLVEPADVPVVRPGVHSVRLFADSDVALGAEPDARTSDASSAPRTLEDKRLVTDLPDERLMTASAPLAAIYLLAPAVAPDVAGTTPDAAVRTRVPGVAAAVATVRHARVGSALGAREAQVVFDRTIAVLQHVPVYELRVVRDFARLDEAVATIAGWHGALAPR